MYEHCYLHRDNPVNKQCMNTVTYTDNPVNKQCMNTVTYTDNPVKLQCITCVHIQPVSNGVAV